MTPPQTPWQKAAERIILTSTLGSDDILRRNNEIIQQACREHAAHLEKDRDCWIFNANELQKAFNKLEKENAELKELLLDIRYCRNSWSNLDAKIEQALATHPTPESK